MGHTHTPTDKHVHARTHTHTHSNMHPSIKECLSILYTCIIYMETHILYPTTNNTKVVQDQDTNCTVLASVTPTHTHTQTHAPTHTHTYDISAQGAHRGLPLCWTHLLCSLCHPCSCAGAAAVHTSATPVHTLPAPNPHSPPHH